MYNKYASQGVTFVLVVGQNAWQYPATALDAAQYKQQHGYQAGWVAVADANWSKMDSAIWDQTNTLPNMSVLDGSMKLLHTTTAWSWINDAEAAIVQALSQ